MDTLITITGHRVFFYWVDVSFLIQEEDIVKVVMCNRITYKCSPYIMGLAKINLPNYTLAYEGCAINPQHLLSFLELPKTTRVQLAMSSGDMIETEPFEELENLKQLKYESN